MNTLYRSLFILILFVAATGGAVAQWSQSIVDVKTDRFPVIDVHVATRQNQALVRTIDSSRSSLASSVMLFLVVPARPVRVAYARTTRGSS